MEGETKNNDNFKISSRRIWSKCNKKEGEFFDVVDIVVIVITLLSYILVGLAVVNP